MDGVIRKGGEMWKGDDGDTKVVIMRAGDGERRENETRDEGDDTRTDDQRHKKMIRFLTGCNEAVEIREGSPGP